MTFSPPERNEQDWSWDLDQVVTELHQARRRWRAKHQRSAASGEREFPSRDALRAIVRDLCGVLFPMRLGPVELRQQDEDYYVGYTLNQALNALLRQLQLELGLVRPRNDAAGIAAQAREIAGRFAAALPGLRALIDTDIEAAYRGDPAARSVDEVLLCYPGIHAIILHRLAHQLYRLDAPLLARIVAEIAHTETGVDIHPGARIGSDFFIDHGTGVVIGETAVIGQRVRLYQAVTLGAKRFDHDDDGVLLKGNARHPIVEDDVVIYAGATILGRITIGQGSVIGGNVWLTRSVPPGSQITQANADTRSGVPA
ncbi:serine acetyltransferase [Chitiniphilus shinanonensis]|uniref:serine O-acetyltransferase n=1 Tax=Chitiniphilus shinanonensis TaxID=553088 RepID=A0ABQ6BRG3_9NEIS|nr:serine O-acetyltransferase EpsC [Chitiniphilus shinanonensis]GLS03932.1 serine acetyltransferase [Chitiniphilus shinanonensis]